MPKKDGKKMILACSCGWTDKKASEKDMEIKEEVKTKEKEIEIIDENEAMLPETEAECPECKNKKAYFWFVQTRAGDEPETRFYRCTQCKHTWREYN